MRAQEDQIKPRSSKLFDSGTLEQYNVKLSCYHSRRTWEDPDVEAGDCEQGEGEEEGGGPGEHQEAAQRAVQGRVGLHRGEVLAPQATAAALHVTCGNHSNNLGSLCKSEQFSEVLLT